MSSAEFKAGFLLLLALSLAACAISLEGAEERPDGPDDVPELESCAIAGVNGRLQSLGLPEELLVISEGLVDGTRNAVVRAPAETNLSCDSLEPLAGLWERGLDASALDPDAPATLRASFLFGEEVWAFVTTSRGFESLGTGLARWEPDDGIFVAGPDYVFSGDRAAYGDAALVDGDEVYAYGCLEVGFLTDACFVARAPGARVHDPTAWTFYQDGNTFGPDPDDAWPLFDGGRGLAVTRFGDFVVTVYATPLGDTLYLRTGLGPTGPWSLPSAVTRCVLPPDSFCGSVVVHSPPPGATEVLVTYGISTFEAIPAAERLTQLVAIPAP